VQRRIALPLVALEQVVRKVRAAMATAISEVPGSMPPPCGAATATSLPLSHTEMENARRVRCAQRCEVRYLSLMTHKPPKTM